MRAWIWIPIALVVAGCSTSTDSRGAGSKNRHVETLGDEPGTPDLNGAASLGAGGASGEGPGSMGGSGGGPVPGGGSAGTADAGMTPDVPTACLAWHNQGPPTISTSVADSNGLVAASRAREALRFGLLPTIDSVRLDDFFNYYRSAAGTSNVASQEPTVELALRSRVIPVQYDLLVKITAPPRPTPRSVLTIVVDTTPSMAGNPLFRAKAVVQALGKRMLPEDSVVVMTTDPSQPKSVAEAVGAQAQLDKAADALVVSENADVTVALEEAYALAEQRFDASAYNRVLFVSDGAEPSSALPKSTISAKANKGIFLVGVGVGPTMSFRERLLGEATHDGRGSYFYVENADDVENLLTKRYDELMGVAYDQVRVDLQLPYFLHRMEEPASETVVSDQARDQYLPPGTSLTLLFRLETCDKAAFASGEMITATVSLKDPVTGAITSLPAQAGKPQTATTPIPSLDKALAIKAYVDALRSHDQQRLERANKAAAAVQPPDADIVDILAQLKAMAPLLLP